MHRMISLQIVFQIMFVGLVGLMLPSIVAAQSTQPTTTKAAADISVEDALADALSNIDQWDQGDRSVVDTDEVEKLNQTISLIQQNQPSNPWLPYLVGRSYAWVGRRHDAIDQIQVFIRTREGRNEWRAYRFLGDLFVDEFARLAKTNYEKALTLKGDDAGVMFGLSRCAYRMGDFVRAIRLAQDAVELDQRRSIRYVSHLSRSSAAVKNWDLALSSAMTALTNAKEKAQNHPGETARLIQVNGQYQNVIDILQARLSDTDVVEILSKGYLQLADVIAERSAIVEKLSFHEVVRVLESAVMRTSPQTPVTLLERYGIALENVGRKADAIEVYQEILQKDSTHSSARRRLKSLQTD